MAQILTRSVKINPMERREHQRFPAPPSISVLSDEAPVQAEVYDLSVGGVALLSETEFSAGSRLSVHLPGSSPSINDSMEIEVLRSALRAEQPQQYITAAIFIEPNPQWIAAAREFIQD